MLQLDLLLLQLLVCQPCESLQADSGNLIAPLVIAPRQANAFEYTSIGGSHLALYNFLSVNSCHARVGWRSVLLFKTDLLLDVKLNTTIRHAQEILEDPLCNLLCVLVRLLLCARHAIQIVSCASIGVLLLNLNEGLLFGISSMCDLEENSVHHSHHVLELRGVQHKPGSSTMNLRGKLVQSLCIPDSKFIHIDVMLLQHPPNVGQVLLTLAVCRGTIKFENAFSIDL
mmetsp:Transcript_51926/g.121529  ORF Transcript_51926/g.121529 Transcript_51926/m.121529 type:complete len:228 (+) Transcript_51926:636-1319(+)